MGWARTQLAFRSDGGFFQIAIFHVALRDAEEHGSLALQGGKSLGAGELFITQGGSNSTLKMPKIRRDTVMDFCFICLVPATILTAKIIHGGNA